MSPPGSEYEGPDDASLDPEGSDLPSSTLASAAASAAGSTSLPRQDSLREIWALAWPVMASQALLNAVGLVDIAMVGRLGSRSVAAVGYASQFFHLSQSVLFGIGFATVALMARAIGAGDPLRARHALAAALLVSVGTAAVLCAAILSVPRVLLLGLGAEPDVAEAAVPYLQLVVGSSLLLAVGMTLEFALRADRDSRTPMWIALAVTSVKIGGNAVLIFGYGPFPALELVGAGLATLFSQIVGLLLFVTVVVRSSGDSPLALSLGDFRACRALVPEVLRLTGPGVGERLANTLSLLAYFRILSEYGSLAIATYTVGVRLLAFTWIPGVALGAAASTLVGQALGAKRRAIAIRAGWRTTWLSLAVALSMGALCLLLPRPLAALFTDDVTLQEALVPFLIVLALAQPALQTHFALGGAHRGAGDTFTPFIASTVGNWLIRVPLAAWLAFSWHAPVLWIWLVMLADHSVRTAWLAISFARGVKSLRPGNAGPAH